MYILQFYCLSKDLTFSLYVLSRSIFEICLLSVNYLSLPTHNFVPPPYCCHSLQEIKWNSAEVSFDDVTSSPFWCKLAKCFKRRSGGYRQCGDLGDTDSVVIWGIQAVWWSGGYRQCGDLGNTDSVMIWGIQIVWWSGGYR